MQGQKGSGNSFSETIDLNQGSVSSNNGPNQPTAWNSMLYPIDSHNVHTFGGWHTGESSSSTSPNLQYHGLGGNVGSSHIPLRESLSRPSSGPTRTPLNINLNAEHMASGSDGCSEAFDTFPFNNVENNDGASSSSLGEWGSSIKRKALDGGNSNSFHQNEAFQSHDFHAFHSGSSCLNTPSPPLNPPSFSQSEELSLRIGIGRGVTSDVFPPVNVTEIGESSSRNYAVRGNHDYDMCNNLRTRNTMRQSEFFNRRQSPRPISPTDTFEFRPPSSSAMNQPQLMHTPEFSRNAPPFPLHGTASSSRLTRNSRGHSPNPNVSEMRNNVNLSLENARNSSNHFPFPWGTPQHHGSSQNPQRSSQYSPWTPFPSVDSEPGSSRRGHFPPLRSDQSSLEETMMSSGANRGNHRHAPFPRPSTMMELQGDDVSGWHALADIEGRHRLIRHVLNAMRRGDNLHDEDYMLFDPFLNGIAEFHDRHRDMRLDVDNMSYEELLALEERIGDVNTGLSEEAIFRSLKQRKHFCLFDRSSSNLEPCSICREEYVLGDDVGELDCGHDFHTDCIKQWLTQKNLCPICKMTALGT